ncbi:hypothetical protein DCC39_08870 [Pueribacillus theae]|uniref:Putative manganese efflux pump MntP n=1 Tax=Pueribacillus theae TaxID=2171751 RepID=A0A2U1K424_9BACI|nr:manganese efflux pump MntP family protein [Pueribacillus theae]PWA11889.1 hypothetical protein DCC39_08870 [Pueribacillus theae]
MDATYIIGELLTLAAMAFALSMDAFSVGLGMGMLQLRLRRIAVISFLTGAFHVVMPLAGMMIGKVLSVHFGNVAVIVGGLLLIFIGGTMIHSSFHDNKDKSFIEPYGIGLIIFCMTVSLDSFSAGLSLGIFGARVLVTVLLFGFASTLLTMTGLLIGKKFQNLFGTYSELIGGSILIAFGIKTLLLMI